MNKFWKIKNEADEDAEIIIYGNISDEPWLNNQTGAKNFADDLKELEGKNVLLRINSPGGDVFAAQAIYNILKAYKGKVTAHIDGLCASAATLVACAADKVIMPRNALYMIHDPKAYVVDLMDAESLRKTAAVMDKVKYTILAVYKAKAKVEEAKLKDFMAEETWMSAEEALENGFVDEIDEEYTIDAEMKAGVVVMNNVSMKVSDNGMEKINGFMERKGKMENEELITKIKNLLGMGEPKEDPAVVAERKRIEDLEALKTEDANPYALAFLDKCKAEGMTAEKAKVFFDALNGVQEKPKENPIFEQIKNLIEDNLDSGANGVKPQPKSNQPVNEKQMEINNIINRINKIRGNK